MKRILRYGALLLGLFAVAAPAATAQGQENAELREKYDKKLQKEFVSKIGWANSLEEARATAKKEGKLVLGYFTRSYAP